MKYLYFLVIPLFIETCFASAYSPIPEQHIVVVTLMYNCEKLCVATLKSIFDQNYHNYHVILIDDNSSDATFSVAQNYINERGMQDKVYFVRNSIRRNITGNHRYAVSLCDDNDIVVHLDGDGDTFAHRHVLTYVNTIYTKYPQTWITLGSFIMNSTGTRNYPEEFPLQALRDRTIRNTIFTTAMRTFKAWLFKQIKHEDFFYRGNYHVYGADLTFLLPMLEMAGIEHFFYIKEIVYHYEDHPQQLPNFALYHEVINYFRSKPGYPALTEPVLSRGAA